MESDNLPEENVTTDLVFRKDRGVTDYELVKTFWIQETKDFDKPLEPSGSPLKPLEVIPNEKLSEESEEEQLPEELLNEPLEDEVFEDQGESFDAMKKSEDAPGTEDSDVLEPSGDGNSDELKIAQEETDNVGDVQEFLEPSENTESSKESEDANKDKNVDEDLENVQDEEKDSTETSGKPSEVSSSLPEDIISQNLISALGGNALNDHDSVSDEFRISNDTEDLTAKCSDDVENCDVEDVQLTFSDPYSKNLAAAFGIFTETESSEDLTVDLLFREPTDTTFELVYTIPLMEDVAVSDDAIGEEEEQADFTFTSPGDNDENTITLTTEVITVLENPNLKSDDTFDDEEEEAFQNAFVKSVETPCQEEEDREEVLEAREAAEDVEQVLREAAGKLEDMERNDNDQNAEETGNATENISGVPLESFETTGIPDQGLSSDIPQQESSKDVDPSEIELPEELVHYDAQDAVEEPVAVDEHAESDANPEAVPEVIEESESLQKESEDPDGSTLLNEADDDSKTSVPAENLTEALEIVSTKTKSEDSMTSVEEPEDETGNSPTEERDEPSSQDADTREHFSFSRNVVEDCLAPETTASTNPLVLSQYDNVFEESDIPIQKEVTSSDADEQVDTCEKNDDVTFQERTVEDSQTPEVVETTGPVLTSEKDHTPEIDYVPVTPEDTPIDLPGVDDSHVETFVAMAEDEHPVDRVEDLLPDGGNDHEKLIPEPMAGSAPEVSEDATDAAEVVKTLTELAAQPLPAYKTESEEPEEKVVLPHQASLEDTVQKLVATVEKEHLVDREQEEYSVAVQKEPIDLEEADRTGSEEAILSQEEPVVSEEAPATSEVQEESPKPSEERRQSNVHFIVGDSSESAADVEKTASEDRAVLEEIPMALEDATMAPEEIPRAEAVTPEEVPSIPNIALAVGRDDLITGGSGKKEGVPESSGIENYVTGLVEDIVKTALKGVDNKNVVMEIVVSPEHQNEPNETSDTVADVPEAAEVIPQGLQSSVSDAIGDISAASALSDVITSLEDDISEKIEEPEVVSYLESLQDSQGIAESSLVRDVEEPSDKCQNAVEAAVEVQAVIDSLKAVEAAQQVPNLPESAETVKEAANNAQEKLSDTRKEEPAISENFLETPDVKEVSVKNSFDGQEEHESQEEKEEHSDKEHKVESSGTEAGITPTCDDEPPQGIISSIADAVSTVVGEIQEEVQNTEDAPDDIFDVVPVVGIPPENSSTCSVEAEKEDDPIAMAVKSAINNVEIDAPDVMKVIGNESPEISENVSIDTTEEDPKDSEECTAELIGTTEEASKEHTERSVDNDKQQEKNAQSFESTPKETSVETQELAPASDLTTVDSKTNDGFEDLEQKLFTTADNFGALPEDPELATTGPLLTGESIDQVTNPAPAASDQIISTADNFGAVPGDEASPDDSQHVGQASDDIPISNTACEGTNALNVTSEDQEFTEEPASAPVLSEETEAAGAITDHEEVAETSKNKADEPTSPKETSSEETFSTTIVKSLETSSVPEVIRTSPLSEGGATVAEVVTTFDSEYDADVSTAQNDVSEDTVIPKDTPTSPIVVVNVDVSAEVFPEEETNNEPKVPEVPEVNNTTFSVIESQKSPPDLHDAPEPLVEVSDYPKQQTLETVPEDVVAQDEDKKSVAPHKITDLHFEIPKEHEDYGNDYVVFGAEGQCKSDPIFQEEDIVTELHFQPIRQWRDEDVISLKSLKSLVAEVGCVTETEVLQAVLDVEEQLSPERDTEDHEETLKILKVVPSEPSLLELDFSDPNVIEVPIPLLEPSATYLEQMTEWIIADAVKEASSSSSKEVVTESEIDDMVAMPEPLMDMKFPHEDEEKTPEPETNAPEEVLDREKTPEAPPRTSKVRFGPLNIKLPRTYSEEQKALEEMLERPLKIITTSPLARPPDQKAPEDEDGALSPLSPGTLAEYEHIPEMGMHSVSHSPNEKVGETENIPDKETKILSPAKSTEDIDEGSECLDSIGDLSERTIQRFNTSIDDPSVRRDSFSSISSFGDRQKFRTAIENIRQDLLPFQSSVSQYLEPSNLLVTNLSMDSPSDLSPNAPPATGFEAFQKSPEHPSAEGSIDSSGFEKVDHEGLEDFGAPVEDPMQQSVFGSLQAEDDDRKTPEDGFVFIESNEPTGTTKKMSSHHDDVIEKNYEAQTAALLESPIAEEARKLVQDAVESASEFKKQTYDDGDDIGKELLDNVKEKAHDVHDNVQEHVVEPVSDTLHRAYDGLGDFVEKVKDSAHDNVVDPVHDAYDQVADFVETVKENAPKQVDEFTREHRPEPEVLPEVQENIHDSVDKVHDEIDNFLRGARAPSPPQEENDEFQEDQKPHFGNQTPEEDETTFDRNGPLTIPEEVSKKTDDLADFDPLATARVGEQFGAAIGSELTEEEMFGHQKFETVPRPPTPPKDISDEDVKPSIVDLGPAHHHSHPGSPHHSILKHHGEAWLDFKTVPPCVLDVIYWRDAKKSAIVLALALLALFVLAKYPLLTVVTYSLLLTLGAAAGFRIFKKVEAQIKKTDAAHPFQEILAKDISLPQEKVHAQADVVVEHATCILNKLKSLVFVESPFESLKFGLVLWSLTYIASWFSGFTLAILGLLGVFSVPKVYEANQEAIDPHLATIQGHLKNVQNMIDEKLPFLRSAPVAAEEKKDQ